MSIKEKIRGFGQYAKSAMEQMKQDLGLALPCDQLLRIAAEYRTLEKREPFVAELRMLDRLATSAPSDYAIRELSTNDGFVAQTYADAMANRRNLSPNMALPPITLGELQSLADKLLRRGGIAPSSSPEMLLGEAAITPKSAAALCRVEGGRECLHPITRSDAPLAESDLFVLLTSKPTANAVSDTDFFCDPRAGRLVKRIDRVGPGGLAALLLRHVRGARIDLSGLARVGEEVPLSHFTDAYHGCRAVCLAHADFAAFARLAAEFGLSAKAFAAVTADARYSFYQMQTQPIFSLPFDFLRRLCPTRVCGLFLPDEGKTAAADPISHRLFCGDASRYIADSGNTGYAAASLSERLLASAVCAPKTSPFRNAFDTALAPVLTLAACGASRREMQLAAGVAPPAEVTPQTVALETAMRLALYRLQLTLGIASIPTLSAELPDTCDAPTLTATAIAPKKPTPAQHFCHVGNRIYCITPKTNADGLYDPAALRALLDRLAALGESGKIKSLRLLCRESVTDTLASMQTDRCTCRMLGDAWLANGRPSLALLVEAEDTLDFPAVALVTERQTAKPWPTAVKLSEQRCLLPTASDSILILAAERDRNAWALEARLFACGATVTRMSPTQEPQVLARALLTHASLLLCEAALPSSPTVDFALETFARANGRILCLGNAKAPRYGSAIRLEFGLSTQNLSVLCKK